MKIPSFLYLDLETSPSKKESDGVILPKKPELSDVKVGNRKGDKAEEYSKERLPELIEEWEKRCSKLQEEAETELRREALDPLKANILCIGYAFDSESPQIRSGSEIEIIRAFNSMINNFGPQVASLNIVGYNIKSFDLELLLHRAIKYKQSALYRYLRDAVIVELTELCTYSKYTKHYYKFDDILKFYDLPTKPDGIDGSKVFDLWKLGQMEEIYNYCAVDVKNTQLLHKRLLDMFL